MSGVRHLPVLEQLLFITDHLDGGAKSEINFHSRADRNTPEKIFQILRENYSCAQSYVAAQFQFFQRTQREGEFLRDYSHALKSLMDLAIRKTPGGIPNSDVLLRDQFVEHVLDDMLRRELKQHVVQQPSIPFVNLRAIAIRWAETSRQGGKIRPRVNSCDSYSQAVDRSEGRTFAVTASSNDEMAEIKECLRKQQAQLDTIMKHVTAQSSQPTQSDVALTPAKQLRFPTDGKLICHRCNRAGHIARFCRVNLTAAKTREGSVFEVGVHRQVGGGGSDSQPSGN